MFEWYNKLLLNNVLKWQFIVLFKPYTGCVKEFYCMMYTIKMCNKTIHNIRSEKNCLCPKNILYQKYNISFFDDLSITQYNKFHKTWDLSFRGWSNCVCGPSIVLLWKLAILRLYLVNFTYDGFLRTRAMMYGKNVKPLAKSTTSYFLEAHDPKKPNRLQSPHSID